MKRQKSKNRESEVRNISLIVKKNLCTSCGTCSGACPNHCITMSLSGLGIFVPTIDMKRCNDCGLCVEVCPGHGFDYEGYKQRLYAGVPDHVTLGSHLKTYTGISADEQVLSLSQSGGIVSTLLLFCIEKNLIDGAVVSKWRKRAPFETQTYIARDRGGILAAVGSKYNPTPAAQILRYLAKKDGRFAFVGTPCQIHGMRKAERIFPSLGNKIALYIGLHCLGVFTYHFHDQMLHKLKLEKKEIAYFHYREKSGGGWPGNMRMIDNRGVIVDSCAIFSRIWPRYYFMNWRCFLCFDKANEFSDVSCGDCRNAKLHRELILSGVNKKRGLSDIVVRTKRAESIVNEAINQGWIKVFDANADSVAASLGVSGKKIGVNTFVQVARLFRLGIPEYGVKFSTRKLEKSFVWSAIKPYNIIFSAQYCIAFLLMRHRMFRNFVKRVPHVLLGIISGTRRIFCEWARFGNSVSLVRFSVKK